MAMTITARGREYASWTVTGISDVTGLEAQFDLGTWGPMERPTIGTCRVLVAGPLALVNPPDTIVLSVARHTVAIRATDTPEIVIRDAGSITVTD